MNIDKLEGYYKTLEDLGRYILTDDFDVKSTLTRIIVILKDMIDYEIKKRKYDSSFI